LSGRGPRRTNAQSDESNGTCDSLETRLIHTLLPWHRCIAREFNGVLIRDMVLRGCR